VDAFSPTDNQRKVIEFDRGRILVKARPGSGKTTTIAHRVARLTKERSEDGVGILCLSYSRSAARAMRDSVGSLIGPPTDPTVISTFHGFAERILRNQGHRIGLNDFTLLETDQSRAVALQLALEDVGESIDAEDSSVLLLGAISKKARRSESPLPPAGFGALTFDEVYKIYVEYLFANRTVDFDLMLIRACEVLASYPKIRQQYQRQYAHIVVDEAQDTGELQFDLLSQLVGEPTKSLACFIDPQQQVNSWLEVRPDRLERLTAQFGMTVCEFDRNFRHEKGIAKLANALRTRTPLGNVELDHVAYSIARDEFDEAATVVEWVHHRRSIRDVPNQSTAVLARSSWLLTAVESALRSSGLEPWRPAEKHGPFTTDALRVFVESVRWRANQENLVTQRGLGELLGLSSGFSFADVACAVRVRHPEILTLVKQLDPAVESTAESLKNLLVAAQVLAVTEGEEEFAALADDGERLRRRLIDTRIEAGNRDVHWHMIHAALSEPMPRPASAIWVSSIHAAKGLESSRFSECEPRAAGRGTSASLRGYHPSTGQSSAHQQPATDQ
jgi:AAA domain